MARKKIKDASFIGPDAVLSIDKADPERTSLHIPLPSGLDMAESADDGEREERRRKDDDTETGDESQQSGESGSGGGVVFDETEDDFDQTELQGMQIPIFRKALKKGLKLVSRVTEQSERYLRNFLPDKDLRSRVVEVALSKNGHPTLLLDKGEIVQYQLAKGKLERVRVSPDLEAERAVKYAMAGFIAAGESVNPKHVKFGRSPEFEARMKPVWVSEWKRMQAEAKNLHMNPKRKGASFIEAIKVQAPKRPSRQTDKLRVTASPSQTIEESRLNMPRAAVRAERREPTF